jgi:DNA modification methylase
MRRKAKPTIPTRQKSIALFPDAKPRAVGSKTKSGSIAQNHLYYGDNIEILRKYIKDETIDLCYIDPPFNSKRNYNQIYNNLGKEDKAQAQAFVDTWTWDTIAEQGFSEIVSNHNGVFTKQSIELIIALEKILQKSSLLSYIVHLTLRIAEIYRVLKPTGSFYLHCDSSASHYLKLILDSIFCARSGEYVNEIIWKRAETVKGNFGQGTVRFDANTDTIFLYSKGGGKNIFHQPFKEYSENYIKQFYKFKEPGTGRLYRLISMTGPGGAAKGNPEYEVMGVKRFWRYSRERMKLLIEQGLVVQTSPKAVPQKKQYLDAGKGVAVQSLWDDVRALHATDSERLGYPTQKPESLLERIIKTSSNEGDTVLDAYCGCGTTVAVAERLNRRWIGMDITYQSISLILKRIEEHFGIDAINNIELNGVPEDFASAEALANKQDDRTRKEFEKWAVLTYSNNRAIINEKKGGDGGIDGVAFLVDFKEKSETEYKEILFSVKSNKTLSPSVIRDLNGTIEREGAAIGFLITLYPMENLVKESKKYGVYKNTMLGQAYPKIKVISVDEILAGDRMEIPTSLEVLKEAQEKSKKGKQIPIPY